MTGPPDRGPRVEMRAGWVALRDAGGGTNPLLVPDDEDGRTPLEAAAEALEFEGCEDLAASVRAAAAQLDWPQGPFHVEAVGAFTWDEQGNRVDPPCVRGDQVIALTEDAVPASVPSVEDGMKLLLVPFRAVLAKVLY